MLRVVDPATFARRQPARAARAAVRGAVRVRRSTPETRAHLPRASRSTTCPPSASGARSRSCCSRRSGRRSASRSRSTSASSTRLFPELQALVGCEQEPEWHPEGDVWVHTLHGRSTRRAARIDDLDRAAAARGDARRGVPRLRQAGDDARSSTAASARSITRRRASRRRRRSSIA